MPQNGYFTEEDLITVPGGQLSSHGAGQAWMRLVLAAAQEGVTISISNGYRSYAEQQRLVDQLGLWSPTNPGAAPPGTSRHGMGEAVDVNQTPEAMAWLADNASRYGWYANVGNEPWHFSFLGTGALAGEEEDRSDVNHAHGSEVLNTEEGGHQVPTELTIPRGGVLLRRGSNRNSNRRYVVRYEVFPGVFMEWETTDAQALVRGGYEVPDTWTELTRYQDATLGPNQYLVEAGDAAELAEFTRGRDITRAIEEAIQQYLPPNHPGRNDPEILAIMAEIVGDPEMSEAEIAGRLQNTQFWQTQNSNQQQWNNLSLADQEARIQDELRNVVATYWDLTGQRLDPASNTAMEWARAVASGEMTFSQFYFEIQDVAAGLPESPFSRRTRDEQIAQRQFEIDIENLQIQLDRTGLAWGLRLSDEQTRQWAELIQNRQNSMADFENMLQANAASVYPGLPEGMRPSDYAMPWVSTLQRTLELGGVDMFDQRVQQAMQSGLNQFEFETQLRQSDDYLTTEGFRDNFAESISAASRQLGFN